MKTSVGCNDECALLCGRRDRSSSATLDRQPRTETRGIIPLDWTREMPTRLPPCDTCQDNLYVREERILTGSRVSAAYYCGRCNHEWQVENPPSRSAALKKKTKDRRRVPR